MVRRGSWLLAGLLVWAIGTHATVVFSLAPTAAAHQYGADLVSAHVRKFDAMRRDLPVGTSVSMLTELPAGGAGELALLDLYAAAVRAELRGETAIDVPGMDRSLVQQLAESLANLHPGLREKDLAQVRSHVLDWWAQLATGQQLTLTRYALAPHVVLVGSGSTLVVGDTPPGADAAAKAAAARLSVVKDYGGGAVLFRRQE